MPSRRNGLAHRALAVVLALGACTGDGDTDPVPPDDPAAADITTAEAGDGDADADGDAATATGAADDATNLVGEATGDTIGVWSSPNENSEADQTLRAEDETDGEIVLLVKQALGPSWLEIYLPTAPAGSTGWVRRDDLTLSRHRFRIEVARSDHTLTVYAGDVAAFETPVAIGRDDVPEPTRGLFIKELVETPEPAGPYGRYAYGLSGSSNELDDFLAGTGVVAIHGTNDPASLGGDVARGSLAIAPEALERLVTGIGLPLGTPVEIHP